MTRYIAVQHESLEIEADTPEQAQEKFLEWLEAMDLWQISIYDAKSREDVTP